VIQVPTPGSVWQHSGIERRSVLIDQAMAMLGVSRRTVYYWIHQGRLQTIRTRCGSQRVLLSSMASLRHSPEPAATAARAAQSYEAFDSLGA
jgi:excisionase family DNA binding protein